MSSDFDASEFVDGDFEGRKAAHASSQVAAHAPGRAPSREEVDTRMTEAQQKLVELKRAQEDLERERASLEETRRRHIEFQTGREEMLRNLTRGLGLLEQAEFAARRDAEQMSKSLIELRASLVKLQAINEEVWTKEDFQMELTRALTAIENTRMEWNSARLKFSVLANLKAPQSGEEAAADIPAGALLGARTFPELCRLGFALTWPVALAVLCGVLLLVALLLRR
jgi:chromosome segregation ATPase